MRLTIAALLIWLSCGFGAMAQSTGIGAYPPGSGPSGPGIGAYPTPLGTPPDTPPGPVESASHHDQAKEYCQSQPGACNVKQPDNHDLAEHQLDEATKTMRDNAPLTAPTPQK